MGVAVGGTIVFRAVLDLVDVRIDHAGSHIPIYVLLEPVEVRRILGRFI